MKKLPLTLALFTLLALSPFAQNAQAWVGVRIGIGVPLYYGPGPYYPYPYYYPPYYAAPAPAVVYQTAPAPAPVVVRSPESEALPAPLAPPTTSYSTPEPAPLKVVPVNHESPAQVNALLQRLSDPNETARRDAAMDLGRLKAQSAIDPLVTVLSKDSSSVARDGAARALGLIGSSRCLNALIYAAQADNDREVRHSAQFAVEVIRTNLRGQ
jgi:hypothetical protein